MDNDTAMSLHYFDSLPSTGSVSHDVSAFLTASEKMGTLAHTRAVVGQARLLAARYCANMKQAMKRAAVAAWCHDMAAAVPPGDLVRVAEDWGVPLTDSDRAVVSVIHGPLAAAVARQRLGIVDEDILNAIRYHSTCRAGASMLEKVVFVADKLALDPTAPRNDFLPDLKASLSKGIDAAALVYLDWVMTNEYALGWTIHAHVRAAQAELSGQTMAVGG